MNEHICPEPATGFFLPSQAGTVFCRYFPPIDLTTQRGNVLYLPPFGEEMNRARRMAAVQARDLAQRGIGVLCVDLFGTGESEGDFGDARWEYWLNDVAVALQWLRQRGQGEISILGLRLGALLALDYLHLEQDSVHSVVLWQPPPTGERHATEILRLKTAQNATQSGAEGRCTVKDLRAVLNQGRSIEVGGYELAPELIAALDRLDLERSAFPRSVRINWIELILTGTQPGPASQRVIQAWRESGVKTQTYAINAQPFWTGQEITVLPELVDLTTRILTGAQ